VGVSVSYLGPRPHAAGVRNSPVLISPSSYTSTSRSLMSMRKRILRNCRVSPAPAVPVETPSSSPMLLAGLWKLGVSDSFWDLSAVL
ncbi:unnamed protein product, partial [Gulo gulo]